MVGMSPNAEDKRILNETINNIQDMREWMIEDKCQGVINPDYADYYIEILNDSEDYLIKYTD